MKALGLRCAIVVAGIAGCSFGGANTGAGTRSAPRPSPSADFATVVAKGSLRIIADPCVGVISVDVYFPIVVTVRKGTQVVYQRTVAAGREITVVLAPGTYLVSAPYDQSVAVQLAPGTVERVHLTNSCK